MCVHDVIKNGNTIRSFFIEEKCDIAIREYVLLYVSLSLGTDSGDTIRDLAESVCLFTDWIQLS
jgi:hypothetical protein